MDKLQNLVQCVACFENEIEWDENGKPDFKINASSLSRFIRVWLPSCRLRI